MSVIKYSSLLKYSLNRHLCTQKIKYALAITEVAMLVVISDGHMFSIQFPSVIHSWAVKVRHRQKNHISVQHPKTIFIPCEDAHSNQPPICFQLMFEAVPSAFTGSPGAVLTHLLRLGCLARARWGKHGGVFNA